MAAGGVAQAETQGALCAAIGGGYLPAAVHSRALDLKEHLETPTRISLLGLPLVGKTNVLNLLAGASVVPEGCDLGTIQVVYGPVEQTTLTLPDRESVTLDGLPTAETSKQFCPALTRVEAPLAALARISLMELGQPADHAAQRRAIAWAVKQTDIMIWCTEHFTTVESGLWDLVPDHVRDHSVLLLTQTDTIRGLPEDAVNALRAHAGDQFRHVLGVSAHEARAAGASGTVDKDRMRASGGSKLISTLLREIEAGRQHIVDQADILLMQHPAPESEDASEQSSIEFASEPAPVEPELEMLQDPVSPVSESLGALPLDAAPVFDAAIKRLQQAGRTIAANVDAAPREVLGHSAEALDWLREHLETADLAETDTVVHLQQMTQDADDLVQLMRIEQTPDIETDAVLLLLQLKRRFQAALAA